MTTPITPPAPHAVALLERAASAVADAITRELAAATATAETFTDRVHAAATATDHTRLLDASLREGLAHAEQHGDHYGDMPPTGSSVETMAAHALRAARLADIADNPTPATPGVSGALQDWARLHESIDDYMTHRRFTATGTGRHTPATTATLADLADRIAATIADGDIAAVAFTARQTGVLATTVLTLAALAPEPTATLWAATRRAILAVGPRPDRATMKALNAAAALVLGEYTDTSNYYRLAATRAATLHEDLAEFYTDGSKPSRSV